MSISVSIETSREFKDLLLKEKEKRGLSYAKIAERAHTTVPITFNAINFGSVGLAPLKRISEFLGLSEELEKDILSPKPGEEDSVGKRIRRLRLSLGLKANELADDLGISTNSVCGYEQDRTCFNYKQAVQISDYFGVSLDYLLRGEEIDG